MNGDIEETHLLSVAEAARILHVSPSTIWRWIDHDVIRAYRVGPKRVFIKQKELEPLWVEARRKGGLMTQPERFETFPMSSISTRNAAGLVLEAKHLQSKILTRRDGKPLPPSWQTQNEMRDERSAQL